MIMKELIPLIQSATGLEVKPFQTNKIEECVIYKEYPLNDDGAVCQMRLELRVVGKSLARCEELSQKIKQVLITIGDMKKQSDILECRQNGGGCLRDESTQTIHNLLYFTITIKSEVNINE